ncbi:MAG TPA: glycosyltransferase 87 family protein [Chloroflexota bacterium]|nr:glycosyltransferase 87 family protein [Chloroflexota bacterium]
MGFWYSWSAALDRGDWRRFYALTGCDYLPGYLYVLWFLGKIQLGIAHAPGLVRAVAPSQDLLYKLPAMAADAATVGLIYLMGRRWRREGAGLLAATGYAVNPGVIFNSSRWGQVDSIPAFFMVLAVVLLIEDKPGWCGIALAVSIVCKPTALVLVAPSVALLAARRQYKASLAFCGGGILTSIAAFAPFVPRGTNFFQFIVHTYSFMAGEFPFLTVNAFNAWMLDQGLLGLVPNSSTILGIDDHVVGWGMLILLSLVGCAALFLRLRASESIQDRRILLPIASVLLVGFFMLLTGMHERHLLPALPMLALTCVFWPRYWVPYLWLSFSYFLNLRFVFIMGLPHGRRDLSLGAILGLAVINLVMLCMLVVLLLYLIRGPRKRSVI